MHPSIFQFTYLTPVEEADPFIPLHRFCDLMPLSEVRKTLNTWLTETLSAEDTIYEDTTERAQLLLTYNQLLSLFDAVYNITYNH
ncbi:hypothetical protein HHL17_04060 [Chitinophaga sp. G-6-1-13]|uniref:Uncharacterized protein n=1 Tax=Chitinophaga fulva TaxID=2728842 RepID=A0A848GI07_9BACT|nr:hypothetical protein [Chitinophaga fulva]NML36360.1 hypothetical protein [Chitinophaga fulva]